MGQHITAAWARTSCFHDLAEVSATETIGEVKWKDVCKTWAHEAVRRPWFWQKGKTGKEMERDRREETTREEAAAGERKLMERC